MPQREPSNVIEQPVASGIEQVSFTSSFDESLQSFLIKDFRPPGYADAPLLAIWLHGAASHQEQGMTAGIYEDAFGRLARALQRRSAIYVCPEYRGGSWMGPAAEEDLLQIIALCQKDSEPGKVLLIGGSMGGTSALIFAARHPRLVDGVIALCPATEVAEMFDSFPEQFLQSYGGGPAERPTCYRERSARLHVAELATLPLVLVHGTADAVIPVEHSRKLIEALRERNAPVLYLEMEGGDHDAPPNLVCWGDCLDFVL